MGKARDFYAANYHLCGIPVNKRMTNGCVVFRMQNREPYTSDVNIFDWCSREYGDRWIYIGNWWWMFDDAAEATMFKLTWG